ncbi:hypothetical protein [Sporosarcina sp. ANT_H38]|uniref:hypothetical protein n=1 Tax=Sporosarcina sp. ANT_H38 TaxID=2597358 RepID=UPI00165E82BE|nr:hypothetical protein [Sporosarcina sp. ANT_H38]
MELVYNRLAWDMIGWSSFMIGSRADMIGSSSFMISRRDMIGLHSFIIGWRGI